MDTAPQSRSRPTTDDRRRIVQLVLWCRATPLRARHSPTRGARRVASRWCSVRGACRGRCRSCVCETSFLAGTPTANALATVCTGWGTSRPPCSRTAHATWMARKRAAFSVSCWCWPTVGNILYPTGVMLWNAGVALDSAIDWCRQSPWVVPPETRAQLCTIFCTLRTRPISSATCGSTRRSRTSPEPKNLVIARGAVSANRDVGD